MYSVKKSGANRSKKQRTSLKKKHVGSHTAGNCQSNTVRSEDELASDVLLLLEVAVCMFVCICVCVCLMVSHWATFQYPRDSAVSAPRSRNEGENERRQEKGQWMEKRER